MTMAFRVSRRLAATLLLVAALPMDSIADTYPSRPIRFVVPFAPGGGSDVLVRSIGARITETTGQPVVIDNKPGANGIVAGALAAKAPADGYTVLLDTTNMVLNALLQKNLTFNAVTDFEPIVMPAWVTHVIAVNPKATPAIETLDQLLARMKASPGTVTYGSFGTGSTAHLAGELFALKTGTTATHVPYKGGGPMITALLANDIHTIVGTVPLVMPYVKSGQLRVLAVMSPKRLAELPDVPTIAERIPGFEVNLWWGFFVPTGTPRPIVDRLNREILAALEVKEVRDRLAPQGFNFTSGPPEQLREQIQAEMAKWGEVIRKSNLKLD